MRKIYNNHVFQRSTKPWQWLATISFAIALLASIGAYVTARSWLTDGRYLQSLDIEQIEVLRLIPALKDLQQQVTGTHVLDSEFFNGLKKADRLLRSMTDDVKLPADNASSSNVMTPAKLPAPVNGSKNTAASKSSMEEPKVVATLSDNPALAFFQKLDSKIMKIVFGKPDKYAELDREEDAPSTPAVVEQKTTNAVDIQDVLIGAKTAEQSIVLVLAQEKGLAGLDILAKSAETLISPKGPLDLEKIATDSPARKYAESLTEFIKANAAWQKNITNASASADLQKALGVVIDQKVLIEIEAGKKTSGKSTLSLTQALPKVHQSPWHTKLPQESASALKMYANNIQVVREFASDHEALRVVAQKNSNGIRLFDFAAAGGFLGLTLVSIVALVFAGLGGLMLLKNSRVPEVEYKRTTKLAAHADELLGSIDLALNKSGGANTQDTKTTTETKSKSSDSIKEDIDRRDLADASRSELKTVVNVITELSHDLKDKVIGIESRMKALSQLGNKLRHSVNTLQDKSAQMRSGSNEQSDGTYGSSANPNRGGPLEQLQDAFFALKQQGVRLYLAILDNHSSKQLAIETEQLNLLVERVEATVSKMRTSLAQALDQAADAQASAPQVSPEVIELISMDAKQVMRDLDLWQEEFDGLNRAFGDLKHEIKA
ncbi:hypothetical protein DCO17_02920 [Polynucleobacter tropicus]|uniref:Uncharacterized protein n=1 Tax=Polynucleobacter tropicus TaxID=1743174 RepID=A0A6M9Q2G7_9BURK|nr:hypothetical protein [Polynucleobacter tropicus]QKM64276.1 hypothetical protein DCO17_02920 [Polynucleobacter tropicus]